MLDRDQGIGVVLEFAAAVLTAEELALVRLEFLDGDGQAVRVVGPEELVDRLEAALAMDRPAGAAPSSGGPAVGDRPPASEAVGETGSGQ